MGALLQSYAGNAPDGFTLRPGVILLETAELMADCVEILVGAMPPLPTRPLCSSRWWAPAISLPCLRCSSDCTLAAL